MQPLTDIERVRLVRRKLPGTTYSHERKAWTVPDSIENSKLLTLLVDLDRLRGLQTSEPPTEKFSPIASEDT